MQYFIFEALPIQSAREVLGDLQDDMFQQVYEAWRGDLLPGLNNLYISQYDHHQCHPTDQLADHLIMKQESFKRARDYKRTNVRIELGDIADYVNNVLPDLRPHIDRLWSAWFTAVTEVTPDEQTALRRLKYPDYLRSTYWRRVRAAMLVVANLRCQSDVCDGLDSWLYGESDLHVHHLHYKNKGRECLDNLIVLCSECHRDTHGLE